MVSDVQAVTATSTDQTVDEAEGFILDHALFSPPRRWPPLPPEPTQSARLQSNAKKMDWEGEAIRASNGGEDSGDLTHSHLTGETGSEGEANKERCVICLMELRDRTIVGVCGHEFCVSPPIMLNAVPSKELIASLNVLVYGQISPGGVHFVQLTWHHSCYMI